LALRKNENDSIFKPGSRGRRALPFDQDLDGRAVTRREVGAPRLHRAARAGV